MYGIWLGRQPLGNPSVTTKGLIISIGVAVTTEALSKGMIRLSASFGEVSADDAAAVFGTEMMPPFPLYVLSASATATSVICGCVWVSNRFQDAAWLTPLVRTGQMALTLYVAHVVIGMGTLESLGRLQDQSIQSVVVETIISCLIATLFAHLWLSRFRRGPLESLFRRIADPKAVITDLEK